MSTFTATAPSVWWAPRRSGWWTGVLFAVGSVCFLVGPFPGFVELVGAAADGAVFFVGSLFFTSAALIQALDAEMRPDRWSSLVQFAGTIFFNVSTYHALRTGIDSNEYNRLVWRPDALGSICFLVSGVIAYVAVRRPRGGLPWWIAAVNLAGCVAFGISAVAGHVVPSTGSALDLAAANTWTALGALCFLIGAILLLPATAEGAQ
jgi:YrhK-like protein